MKVSISQQPGNVFGIEIPTSPTNIWSTVQTRNLKNSIYRQGCGKYSTVSDQHMAAETNKCIDESSLLYATVTTMSANHWIIFSIIVFLESPRFEHCLEALQHPNPECVEWLRELQIEIGMSRQFDVYLNYFITKNWILYDRIFLMHRIALLLCGLMSFQLRAFTSKIKTFNFT